MCRKIWHRRYGSNHHLPQAKVIRQATTPSAATIRDIGEDTATEWKTAERMVELAGVGPGDTVIDPGCGQDLRLLLAAREAGASRLIGFEIDPLRAAAARQLAKSKGASNIEVWNIDARLARMDSADIVLVYLYSDVLAEIASEMTGYARAVVSNAHPFPGSEPAGNSLHAWRNYRGTALL